MKLVLEPGRAAKNYWLDLWHYRELLYFLAWRDLAVRYKQTVIGVVWALIRPALTMLVFVGFRRVLGLHRSDVPEPLFVLCGVLPWQFFSSALSETSGSLIGNANLIGKTYFPRLLVPCAAVATSLVDCLITIGMLGVLLLAYGAWPGWPLLALPVFIVLALVLALGAGLLLAALNVEYRDFRYVVPFLVQFGLFVSPVAFTTADVPARWRILYAMNPMVGVIEGFRWSVVGRGALDLPSVAMSVGIAVVLLLLGVWYFRRTERGFADVI